MRVVHGGADVGLELARSPVDKLLFTGSPSTGRAVAKECVSREKEVTVELGGKDAMIAAPTRPHRPRCWPPRGALWAGCAAAGQARGAVERIYAAPETMERLVARLVGDARALRVGDPRDPGVQVGPGLLRAPIRARAWTGRGGRRGRSDSALYRPGPARGSRWTGRCVERTTRYAQLRCPQDCHGRATHEMRIMREPIGGPVLTVMEFGSVSAIFWPTTAPTAWGRRCGPPTATGVCGSLASSMPGMVWLNDHLPSPAVSRGPWGAAAGSGLGRTLGEAGLRACAQEKLITWDPSGARGLWWGPYDEVAAKAARAATRLRSTREGDREAALREGGAALARAGIRALGRRS